MEYRQENGSVIFAGGEPLQNHVTITWNDLHEMVSAKEECFSRAEKFFHSFLTDVQRKSWCTNGAIPVLSQRGNTYLLYDYIPYNVYRPDIATEYCLDTCPHLPRMDVFAFQKFLLEHNEDYFLKIANHRMVYYHDPT